MNTIEMSNRDPYPFPKLENDANFYGTNAMQSTEYEDPTHLAQTKDPWNRLNTTCTLASSRREVYHYDPKAPRDSLDFVLKANYDHHGELLKSKSETLKQPETIGTEHGRVLKNRTEKKEKRKEMRERKAAEDSKPSVVNVHNPKKESYHSVKGAIESHHTPATNQGFSRKHDGGFYTT